MPKSRNAGYLQTDFVECLTSLAETKKNHTNNEKSILEIGRKFVVTKEQLGDFGFLLDEPGPKMLLAALDLYGITEIEGEKHNPKIMKWAKDCGLESVYKSDEIPWCGLFIAELCRRTHKKAIFNPLWARNWSKWGTECPPELGCVLVFERGSGGHVGLYVGEDEDNFFVLGGNQGNRVSIVKISKKRLLNARCLYNNKPLNIRPINMSSNETKTTTNEA